MILHMIKHSILAARQVKLALFIHVVIVKHNTIPQAVTVHTLVNSLIVRFVYGSSGRRLEISIGQRDGDGIGAGGRGDARSPWQKSGETAP